MGRAYDMLKAEDRNRIRERMGRDRPCIVIGCQPCADYTWLNEAANRPRMTPEHNPRTASMWKTEEA